MLGVSQGHWKWHHWIDRIRVFYSSSIVTIALSSYRFRAKAKYWSKIAIFFHTPFDRTTQAAGENGCEYFRAVFYATEPDIYSLVMKTDSTKSPPFAHSSRAFRQTDRRTSDLNS